MMYGQGGPWSMGGGGPGMGGMPGMGMGIAGGMGMNPYQMAQSQGQFGHAQHVGSTAGSPQTDSMGNELKPFDSSQMKRGRMGHYGYLDGRGKS